VPEENTRFYRTAPLFGKRLARCLSLLLNKNRQAVSKGLPEKLMAKS
jgi:hypothetical protein